MLEIFIALIIFCLDQITKFFVVSNMHTGQSIDIINNIFSLTYVQNTGVAFGMLNNNNFLIIILLMIVFPILIYFVRKDLKQVYAKYKKSLIFRLAIGFFVGGALGNIVDRVFRGYVVDMFDFRVWPVFNVADSFICIAIGIFCWLLVFRRS